MAGAYENPNVFVDTQSGAAYSEMQRSIAASMAGAIKGIGDWFEENKKKNKETEKEVGKETEKLYQNVSGYKSSDATINWDETFRPYIKEYAELRTKVLNGTSTDPAKDRERIGKILGLVGNIKDSLVNITDGASDWDELRGKIGMQGGIDAGSDPNIIKSLNIWGGFIPGSKKIRIDEDLKINWDFYDQDNNVITSMTGDALAMASEGRGLLQKIPDLTGNFEKVSQANKDIFKFDEKGKWTGEVNDAFLTKNDKGEIATFERPVPGKDQITVDGKITRTVQDYKSYKRVDIESIKNNPNFRLMVDAQSSGYIDADASNSQAVALYNNVMRKAGEEAIKGPMTDEQKQMFKEKYATYILNGVPKEIEVEGIRREQTDTPVPKAAKGAAANRARAAKAAKEAASIKQSEENLKNLRDGGVMVTPDGKFTIEKSGNDYIVYPGKTVNLDKALLTTTDINEMYYYARNASGSLNKPALKK
jgi:hypothetical protein